MTRQIFFRVNILILSMLLSGLISYSQVLLPVKIGDKYGYIDEKGEVSVKAEFEFAQQFSDGLAAVKIEGKKGFIDKTGKIVISAEYDKVEDFKEGLSVVKKSGIWSYIDKMNTESWKMGLYR